MPRAYKNPSIVSGMTIQDILNMDEDVYNDLSESDKRKVVGRLVSAGNKRLRSFEKIGERSPSTRHIEKSGGAFSTKGKDLNALKEEYSRAKGFLKSRTSTRKGWAKVKRETTEQLNRHGIDVDVKQFDDLWETYEKLQEEHPDIAGKKMKYKVLTDISAMLDDPSKTPEDIAFELSDKLDEIYEKQAEQQENGVSEFFEIE